MGRVATLNGSAALSHKYPVAEDREGGSHLLRNTALGLALLLGTGGGVYEYKASEVDLFGNIPAIANYRKAKLPPEQNFAEAFNRFLAHRSDFKPVEPSQVYAMEKMPGAWVRKLAKRNGFKSIKAFMEAEGFGGEAYIASFSRDSERPDPKGIFGEGYYLIFRTKEGKLQVYGSKLGYITDK